MTPTALFIPTFMRAGKLQKVCENIHSNTPEDHKIYFIVEASDGDSLKELDRLGESYFVNSGKGCYAACINLAYLLTEEDYFFCGSDDLNFHPNWLSIALDHMQNNVCVVGTNDMANPDVLKGEHATHFLVKREYIKSVSGCIDRPNTVMFEYNHNYCDTEFIQTAKMRGVFEMAFYSYVEHLHPCWNKGKWDSTYSKGSGADSKDRLTFDERTHLWTK